MPPKLLTFKFILNVYYDMFENDRYFVIESGLFNPYINDETFNYRSLILDNFEEYIKLNKFDLIKVSVYKNNIERAWNIFKIFDKNNTNITNWFSLNNWVDSTYYDIADANNNDYSYFSIQGDMNGDYIRNFLITDTYTSCTNTQGMFHISNHFFLVFFRF